MKETGVIKFNCNWVESAPLDLKMLTDIINWREKMFKLGFIGVNDEGIGYGNISVRLKENQFIISGSSTGKFKTLTNQHFTKVTDFDIENNSLTAVGPIIASSESLTHAIIYERNRNINAVIHIHSFSLWKKFINKVPTSSKEVEYGTPLMAKEIIRLFDETDLTNKKTLVMAGHIEGIISFGKDLNEAGNLLISMK